MKAFIIAAALIVGLGVALFFVFNPLPAAAGGPVVVEDEAVVVASEDEGSVPKWVVPVLGAIVVGLILSGNGDDSDDGGVTCFVPEDDGDPC